MKSILQSIKPQYCELIASGKKTIEVRKTRPKLDVPFKVYIYCTKGENLWKKGNSVFLDRRYNHLLQTFDYMLNGKVIGEYVCDRIEPKYCANGIATYYENEQGTCLSDAELQMYADGVKPLYFWHISDLKIYDKPKELSEFYRNDPTYNNAFGWAFGEDEKRIYLTHPPQSWCYVEEV